MRTFVIPPGLAVVALAVVAVGGASACTSSAGPSSPSPAAVTTVADETRQICAQAISESTAAAAEFKTKLNEGVQAVLAGDQARANQIENELHERVDAWAATLTELSKKSIEGKVRATLIEAADTLMTLNSDEDETPVNRVEVQFVELATTLGAACGLADPTP